MWQDSEQDDQLTGREVVLWLTAIILLIGEGLIGVGLFKQDVAKEDRSSFFIGGGVLWMVALPPFVIAYRKQRRFERWRKLQQRAATGAFFVRTRQTTGRVVAFTVGLAQRYGVVAVNAMEPADVNELTLGGISQWMHQLLENDAQDACAYAQPDAFDRIIDALDAIGIDTGGADLATPLAQLIPSRRRAKWKELSTALGVPLPPLPPTHAVRALLGGIGAIGTSFTRGQVGPRAMLIFILLLPVLLPVALIGMLVAQVMFPFFGQGFSTVGELAALVGRHLQTPPGACWTAEEVWAQVRQTAAQAFAAEARLLKKEMGLVQSA